MTGPGRGRDGHAGGPGTAGRLENIKSTPTTEIIRIDAFSKTVKNLTLQWVGTCAGMFQVRVQAAAQVPTGYSKENFTSIRLDWENMPVY